VKVKELVVGEKYGRLVVREAFRRRLLPHERRGRAVTMLVARCDCSCGGRWEGNAKALGRTQSCGCYAREKITRHGLTTTPLGKKLYQVWQGMMHRCHDEKYHNYRDYGGRGIRVCDEWKQNPVTFVDWAKASGYKPGLTLDRKDVNGHYEPMNCRWATVRQQQRNRRTNSTITAWGETKLICEWMEDPRVTVRSRPLVMGRIRRGWWTPELALTTPPGRFGTRPLAFCVAREKETEATSPMERAVHALAQLAGRPLKLSEIEGALHHVVEHLDTFDVRDAIARLNDLGQLAYEPGRLVKATGKSA
jgi:hypothetical protein